MVTEALTWASLISSAGAIVTFITFWIKIGRELEASKKDAADAKTMAVAAAGKADLVAAHLSEFKISSVRDFASIQEMQGLENRLASQLEILGKRMDRMVDRIDRFLDRQSDRPRQDQ